MLLRPRNGFRCMMQESGSFPSHHRPSDRLWQAEGETRDVGPFSHLSQWSVGGGRKIQIGRDFGGPCVGLRGEGREAREVERGSEDDVLRPGSWKLLRR